MEVRRRGKGRFICKHVHHSIFIIHAQRNVPIYHICSTINFVKEGQRIYGGIQSQSAVYLVIMCCHSTKCLLKEKKIVDTLLGHSSSDE